MECSNEKRNEAIKSESVGPALKLKRKRNEQNFMAVSYNFIIITYQLGVLGFWGFGVLGKVKG